MKKAFLLIMLLACPQWADPLDADALAELVGYTVIAASNVAGDFEGADDDKPVKLDNGMVFEFTGGYSYTYTYRPTAVVFARTFSLEELQKMGIRNRRGPMTLYKLVVEDEIYDVRRLR